MAIELSVFSRRPPITPAELAAASRRQGLSVRLLLDEELIRGTLREPDPHERAEYEASLSPETLATIKASRTRYALRAAIHPPQSGRLLGKLSGVLTEAAGGFLERA